MTDIPNQPPIATIPTAADKMAGDFAQITRFWAQMREAAEEIAATRRTLFEAYVAKGFTQTEALTLVSGSLLL